jgi:2-dehydropantoate 2-reductase
MPKSPPSLRIALLGVGNIGSAFAFQLARAGHDVTAIARPGSARLQQLERDGAIVDVKGERAKVQVCDALDEQAPYDLVIVTLMAHQVDAVLPALQRSAAKAVQFMFNTFQPEKLGAAVGIERCALGMPFVQAKLDDDGRIKVSIGAGGQKSLMSEQRWADVFNAAGLPAAVERNMALWLRCHAPFCVAFESVSVAGLRRGGGAAWNEAMVLSRGVHASFRLIEGLGYRIYPQSKAIVAASPAWVLAAMLWFMSRIRSFRELLATGQSECCALVDVMAAAAESANAPGVATEIAAMKPS